jgi:hypothetical protein
MKIFQIYILLLAVCIAEEGFITLPKVNHVHVN